jgi:hypothetical protein
MTNTLFNGLQVVSGEVKAELVNDSVDIEVSFHGEVTLTKGNFEQTQNYYFNRCEVTRYGYVDCDDWDIEEGYSKLGGLPIDSLQQLKSTLQNSGLSTLAKSLGFDETERRKLVFLAFENGKGFKKQFGKNAIFWRVLNDTEQKIVKLNYAIDNYATCGEHDKYCFGIVKCNEDDEPIRNYVPTIEELKELLETLTKV